MSANLNGESVDTLQDGSPIVDGNDLFSKDSAENAPVKSDRIIRKAKRPSKQTVNSRRSSGSGDDEDKTPGNGLTSARLPFSKNSRKSRNNKGRGLPKKGTFQ